MGYEPSLGELVEQIKHASENITDGDARTNKRLDGIEKSINELYLKHGRSGGCEASDDASFDRKDARDLCMLKHELAVPKNDGLGPAYQPSANEIDDAMLARKAMKALFRHGNMDRLDHLQKKSLTAFSFGTNSFIMAPEMSDAVLSCLVDPTDFSGYVNNVAISAGSIKFLIDNVRMQNAAWACESSCRAGTLVMDRYIMKDVREGDPK